MTTIADRDRRLRVAHVTLGLEMGGLEKLLVEFARHADRRRYELVFVCLTGRGCLAEEIEACGWPVEALEEPLGLRPGLVLRLARLFRRWQVDVVHTHDDRPLVYGAAGARLAGVGRVIHTRHGKVAGVTSRRRWLVQAAARLTTAVVCVCRDAARLSVAQGISARRVRTLWNGIDVARFTYTGPSPGGLAVAVARLSPEKDVETLVRAAALAVQQDPTFQVEIAGDGPCRPALKLLVDDLGLGQHVHLLGEVRDIPALLARAGLFVLPSRSEGLSLTLLEAMARGLPVVATAVGGNPEAVVDGETGLLVPPGKPDVMAETLLRLRGDPVMGRHLGQAGRERVECCFDIRRMVADYERLYEEKEPAVCATMATGFQAKGCGFLECGDSSPLLVGDQAVRS